MLLLFVFVPCELRSSSDGVHGYWYVQIRVNAWISKGLSVPVRRVSTRTRDRQSYVNNVLITSSQSIIALCKGKRSMMVTSSGLAIWMASSQQPLQLMMKNAAFRAHNPWNGIKPLSRAWIIEMLNLLVVLTVTQWWPTVHGSFI
jgi:hypothetical protein